MDATSGAALSTTVVRITSAVVTEPLLLVSSALILAPAVFCLEDCSICDPKCNYSTPGRLGEIYEDFGHPEIGRPGLEPNLEASQNKEAVSS